MSLLKTKTNLVFFALLGGFILYTFWGLWNTFYQQDEWLGLGQVLSLKWGVVTNGISPLGLFLAQGRPLSRALGVLLVDNFPFQALPLAIYSLLFHFLNTCLVYVIGKRVLKSSFFGFLASLFFCVSAVSHQNVTWFAASFGGLPSSFFIFLSIYLMLCYVDTKKKKFLSISLVSGIISFYFKETGIFLLIFLPFIVFLSNRKIFFTKKAKKIYLVIGIVVLLFAFYRIRYIVPSSVDISKTTYVNVSNKEILPTLIIRSVYYPLTSFSLSYLPPYLGNELGLLFLQTYYPYITVRPDLIAQTIILDQLSILVSLIVLFVLFVIAKESKEKQYQVIFATSLFILSLLPYILISKGYAYLEPRYYYLSMAASGLVFAIIIHAIVENLKRMLFLQSFIWIIVCLFLTTHIMAVKKDIRTQIDFALERKAYLSQLLHYLPTLTSNTNVFYITGEKPWLDESNYTPFQHNFAYSLLVLYYNSHKIPEKFLKTEDLWIMGRWGLYRDGNKSFAYVYTIDQLKEIITKNNLSLSSIHAFYYENNKKNLRDITQEVRGKVELKQ